MLRRTARLAIFATLLSLALFAPSASAQSGCTMTGTAGPDTLVGTSGPDVICGFGGDDLLLGEGGNDTIHGGDGNDRLEGGDGEDVLIGGLGRDVLLGGADDDTLNGGGGDDPEVDGEGGNDAVNGGSGDDTVRGGEGDDTVHGDTGRDRVSGGPGDDDMFGDGGNDEVFGVDGNGGETVDCGAGSGDLANGDPGDIIGSNCEGRIQSAELAVTLGDNPDPIDHFSSTVFTVSATNAGTMPAFAPKIFIDFGTGLTPTAWPANCAPAGGNDIECNVADIAPGQTRTRNITVQGTDVGTHTSTATVSTTSPETFTGNNTDSEQTTVTPIADLIADAQAPTNQPNGTVATWRGEVANAGPDPAANTVMTMTFGTGVSIAGPLPAGCVGAGPVVCSIGTLAAGASTTRDIPVRADQTGNKSFTVNVGSDTKDPDLTNNTVSRTINVTPNADLDVDIADNPDPVLNGQKFTYQLDVSNDGPNDAPNTQAVLFLPPAGVVLDGPLPAQCSETNPGEVTCSYGTLSPLSSHSLIISVRATQAGTHSSQANASSSAPDADGAVTFEDTTVQPAADVSTAVDAPGAAAQNATFPFDVRVQNFGPNVANNVTLTVTLDTSMEFRGGAPVGCSLTGARTAVCGPHGLSVGPPSTLTFQAASLAGGVNKQIAANVTSTTADPDTSNNTHTDTVTIP